MGSILIGILLLLILGCLSDVEGSSAQGIPSLQRVGKLEYLQFDRANLGRGPDLPSLSAWEDTGL